MKLVLFVSIFYNFFFLQFEFFWILFEWLNKMLSLKKHV